MSKDSWTVNGLLLSFQNFQTCCSLLCLVRHDLPSLRKSSFGAFQWKKKVSAVFCLYLWVGLHSTHSWIQFCLNLVMEFSQRSYTIPSNCKGDVYVSGIDAVGWIVWSSRQCKLGGSTLVWLDMCGFFIWSNRILGMILDIRITGFGF